MRTSKLLSKGDLCRIFGLWSPSTQRKYYLQLQQKVFTDTVLSEIGLKREDYRKIRVFSADQSAKIVSIFKIDEHELNE